MTLSNPVKVVRKISEDIRKGKLINQGKILRDVGYSKETSLKPKLVTETKAFKREMELQNRPLLEGIQKQINKFKDEIERRNLTGEDTRTLVGSMDIYIKNYQLLSGGATTRQVFVLPSEILDKNDITIDNDKDI